jgi:hypothetical protein
MKERKKTEENEKMLLKETFRISKEASVILDSVCSDHYANWARRLLRNVDISALHKDEREKKDRRE